MDPRPLTARDVVRAFTRLRYNAADWEKLVSKGELLEVLGIELADEAKPAAAARAARALRAKFPELTRGRRAWEIKVWSDHDLDAVIELVAASVEEHDSPSEADLLEEELGSNILFEPLPGAGAHGFVGWRLFRRREPTPSDGGVYMLGLFDSPPTAHPDPSDERVIYIGKTDQTYGISARLEDLARTTRVGTGHSGGFSYRLEIWPGDFARTSRFHKTYVSWRVLTEEDGETPRTLESRLIREYEAQWGRRPKLNKTG